MANLKENNLTNADIQEYCERIVYYALEGVDPYQLILDDIKIRNSGHHIFTTGCSGFRPFNPIGELTVILPHEKKMGKVGYK